VFVPAPQAATVPSFLRTSRVIEPPSAALTVPNLRHRGLTIVRTARVVRAGAPDRQGSVVLHRQTVIAAAREPAHSAQPRRHDGLAIVRLLDTYVPAPHATTWMTETVAFVLLTAPSALRTTTE